MQAREAISAGVAMGPPTAVETVPRDYPEFLAQIESRIVAARTSAVLAANTALIELYWEIGNELLSRSTREGWGTKVVERLAADLRREFPDMTGLSRRNLLYMRALAEAWPRPDEAGHAIVQQPCVTNAEEEAM